MYTDRKIDFEIVHKKSVKNYSMSKAHEHPYYEIGYMIAGERRIFIDHTSYHMQSGDLLIIPRQAIHRAIKIGDQGTNQIMISFAAYYLDVLIRRYGEEEMRELIERQHFHFELDQKRPFERFLHQMLHDYRHADRYTVHQQQIFIESLFITLMRMKTEALVPNNLYEDEMHQRIDAAAKYISQHYNEEITLAGLAQQYDLSSSYFTRQFKQITGFGFKEYLIIIRIREAARLLINTNLSVTEIALKCGFNDSNYFGDVFKKVKGVSPRAYRKASGFI